MTLLSLIRKRKTLLTIFCLTHHVFSATFLSRLKPMAILLTQKVPAKMNLNLNGESPKTGNHQGMSKELTIEHCLWRHRMQAKT